MPQCSCGGQRTTCGGSLFTHQVMGDQIQVGSLGGKLPYPWSQLAGPIYNIVYNVPVTVNFPPWITLYESDSIIEYTLLLYPFY